MKARQDAGRNPPSIKIHDQLVYFADSQNLDFIDDGSVDFAITSPPYWNLKDYGHEGQIGRGDYATYLDQLNTVWEEMYRITKPNASLVVNVGNRRHQRQFFPIAFDIHSKMRSWTLWDILIWYVPNALPQPASYRERLFDSKYEFLLVFTKDGGKTDYTFHKPRVPNKYREADHRKHKMNPHGRCLGNIVRIPAYRPPNIKSMHYHVASYPDELVALMIETMTDRGDVVFDPFLGSGTTLKVAGAMGRRGMGVEINREFEDVIRGKVGEPFEVPDWRSIDLIHSVTLDTGPRSAVDGATGGRHAYGSQDSNMDSFF